MDRQNKILLSDHFQHFGDPTPTTVTHIADPVRTNEGQPCVPDILRSLREKVNRLTPTVQNIREMSHLAVFA